MGDSDKAEQDKLSCLVTMSDPQDLWNALKANSYAKLKSLLESGADVRDATKQDGWSLLHEAAYHKGNLRMVKLLLQHNADVNAKVVKTNWTPLHSAVISGDKVLVEELLKQGADQSVKATKRDIRPGEEFSPKEMAEVTGFRHMQVFKSGQDEETSNGQEENIENKKANTCRLGRTSIAMGGKKCNIDGIRVKVTKQDTGQSEGSMMEEFLAFTRTYFPKFGTDHLKFPRAFLFDTKKIPAPGPVDAAHRDVGQQRGEDREKAILGAKGEEKIDEVLHKVFQSRTSLMWNGFEKAKLFKIAKDCITFKLNEAKSQTESLLEMPLLPEEKELLKLFGIDASQLESDVEEFVKELFSENKELDEAGLKKALEEKCRNPAQLNPQNPGRDKRPVFEHLCGREQTNYRENLIKHLKKAFEPSKKKGKKDKSSPRKHVQEDEVGNYFTRYFLSLLEKQAEFDHVLVDQESSTFFHVEVKTYPQRDQILKEGLSSVLTKAKDQLAQGDALFNNVLGPAAKLSRGWTKVNMLAFPSIENRDVFQNKDLIDEPLSDDSLRYILTKAELKKAKLGDDSWFKDLKLGSRPANPEEYERLLAIIIGSAHVSYNSQLFDYQKEIRDAYKRVAGDAIGIGELPGAFTDDMDPRSLKKKPLGHVQNIIFWNDEQMQLLNDLKNAKSLVLCGDYGGGKTSVMVSAAQKAAKEGFKVFVITTTSFEETVDTGYILDVAMKEKFRELNSDTVDIEVVSLMEIRKKLSLGFNFSVTDLIKKFMESITDQERVKIYFDEFPVSKSDLEAVRKNKDGDLTKMLRAIHENSHQAYVSLKTTCLLDTIFVPGAPQLREVGVQIDTDMLKNHIEDKSEFKVRVLQYRMRNVSRIGRAVVGNMKDYAVKQGAFPVACVLEPGKSDTTVPGERPHCVVGEIGAYKKIKMDDIAMCLNFSLTELLHLDRLPVGKLPPHIVILCGDSIPPREVRKT